MSSLIVEVCKVSKITTHPNADRLEIATIKGWECIVQRDSLKCGDLVVYAPFDSLIPLELSEKMDVTRYLGKGGRVKTAKMRGGYSQGLVISMEYLPKGKWKVGDNVADVLGITKYELPIPLQMAGDIRAEHPRFIKYTNIEHYKNFPDVLEDGEEVAITEKIHGTNFRCANINGEFYVGSHNRNLKENPNNLYWKIFNKFELCKVLKPGEQLFGEICGKGVQALAYDMDDIGVIFFDLIVNTKYVDEEDFALYCIINGLYATPLLYEGEWHSGLLEHATGKSAIANHIREGCVIKPINERFRGKNYRRVIFKHINPDYLLKNYTIDNFNH